MYVCMYVCVFLCVCVCVCGCVCVCVCVLGGGGLYAVDKKSYKSTEKY